MPFVLNDQVRIFTTRISKSGAIGTLVFFLFLMIHYLIRADHPQNPDGAEWVRLVQNGGGVPHSPGYPLQAWLALIFAKLPLGSIVERLSALSGVLGAGSAALIALTGLELGWGLAAVFVALWVYGFAPSVLYLSVQPEKYALLWFWAWLSIYFSVRAKRGERYAPLLWMILFGIAPSTHVQLVALAPLYLYVGIRIFKGPLEITQAVAGVIAIAVAINASLFLLSGRALWPDWGKIETLRDWWGVLTREGWSGVVAAGQGDGPRALEFRVTGLTYAISDLWDSYGLALLASVLGLFAALKAMRTPAQRNPVLVFCACVAITFFGLSKMGFPIRDLPQLTYLERYAAILAIPIAILAGYGVQGLHLRLAALDRRFSWAFLGLIIAGIATYAPGRIMASDPRGQGALDHYSVLLGTVLKPQDVFGMGNDLEMFYGVQTEAGLKYPVIQGYDWAEEKLLPQMDEDLYRRWLDHGRDMRDAMESAHQSGRRVVASTPIGLPAGVGPRIQWGPMWMVLPPGAVEQTWSDRLRAAVDACEVASLQTVPLPKERFYGVRYYWAWIPETLRRASKDADRLGPTGQKYLQILAMAIARGDYPAAWREECQRFKDRVRSLLQSDGSSADRAAKPST